MTQRSPLQSRSSSDRIVRLRLIDNNDLHGVYAPGMPLRQKTHAYYERRTTRQRDCDLCRRKPKRRRTLSYGMFTFQCIHRIIFACVLWYTSVAYSLVTSCVSGAHLHCRNIFSGGCLHMLQVRALTQQRRRAPATVKHLLSLPFTCTELSGATHSRWCRRDIYRFQILLETETPKTPFDFIYTRFPEGTRRTCRLNFCGSKFLISPYF